MVTPLLTTKLYIPSPRPNLVPRPRLIRQLDEGLSLGHRLTLISAPAGFGKTTLISAWVGEPARPAAWLSLDEEDNDPIQFLSYLIAALQRVDARMGRSVLHLLQAPQTPPVLSLIILLINDVSTIGIPLVLVLDDFHMVTSSTVHKALEFLLDHQPDEMHLVVSTREDPPLSLARLRARGQITEIRERDLRFTFEEAAAFLGETMSLSLAPELVQALEARTEGWIAGLQLAALALQKETHSSEAFVASFTGDDRYVMDYLVTEVLQRLPPDIRDFLRQTSILERLCGPLCDAVTGREVSQSILEHMEAANLFLIPLDHRREWYRYHRLFAEFLRITLDRGEQAALHHRAMHWYEEAGLASQAVPHALSYASLSGEFDDAERLIAAASEGMMHLGHIETVHGWLDALPEARVRSSSELATFRGWILALTGDLALAEEYARVAGTGLSHGEATPLQHARLILLRGLISMGRREYAAAIEQAASALALLPDDQPRWRILALWTMAESQERTGNITGAIETLRKAGEAGRALGNLIFAAVIEAFLAAALHNHGQRREAVAACEQAIERFTDEAGQTAPVAGYIYSWLGRLYYEANELDLARTHLDLALDLSQQIGRGSLLTLPYSTLAMLLHAHGETEAALDALRRAYQFDAQESLADANWVLAWETNIRLRQGDLPSALRWVENAGVSADDPPQYLLLESQLTYARVLVAQGQIAAAQAWLARLEGFTREQQLHRWLITVRILQALAADYAGDRAGAVTYVSSALEMAAPEDYFRAFLDEDDRVIALVEAARRAAPSFVDRLLEYATGATRPEPVPSARLLDEPLSERELEVLSLIAAGSSNAEIADRLVIAVGTVKRHINNIYGKLGVASRTQAVARARQLKLLG